MINRMKILAGALRLCAVGGVSRGRPVKRALLTAILCVLAGLAGPRGSAAESGIVFDPSKGAMTGQLDMGNYAIYSSSAITAARYQIYGADMLTKPPGESNLSVGFAAGHGNTGTYNTFVGGNAGYSDTTGLNNTFVGAHAGYSNISGYSNSFVGFGAGYFNTGNENSFVGSYAGRSNTAGIENSFIGFRSGYYNQAGSYNVLVGKDSGFGVSGNSYSNSTLMGYRAGYGLTTGSNNIFLGYQAGYNVTSGAGNIVIGYDQRTPAPTTNNSLNIGGLVFGDLSAKTIGISTRAPQAALDVVSTGTASNVYAQIWRDSTGLIVSSMTATGVLYPAVSGADNTKVAKTGDTMTGQLTLAGSTLTVTGSAFSVGGSTFAVSAGKVGVGTSSPDAKFEVKQNTADANTYALKVSSNNGAAMLVVSSQGSVGIGLDSPDTALELAGAVASNFGGIKHYRSLAYYNGGGTLTGTLKITMPKLWSSTMMLLRIEGYNYDSAPGHWEVLVSGYNYGPSGPWYAYSAEIRGKAPFSQVRLASDGTKNVLLLGHTGTDWYYPKVAVSELVAGAGQAGRDGWGSGWGISLISSETGIVDVVSPAVGLRTVGSFLVSGSTNPTLAGTVDRGMVVTAGGRVGIAAASPAAALDVVAEGAAVGDYAQIWRNSAGTIVSSMTATGVLYPAVSGADNTKVAKTGDTMTGQLTLAGSTLTVTGSAFSVGGSTLVVRDGKVGIGNLNPDYELDFSLAGSDGDTRRIRFGSVNNQIAGGGIVFAPNYSGYTKRSAGILHVGEANVFRGGLAFYANNAPDLTTDWVERMRLSMNGELGIGTNAPGARLEVKQAVSDAYAVKISSNDGAGMLFVSNKGLVGIGNSAPSYELDFATPEGVADTKSLRFGPFNSAGTGGGVVWAPNYAGYTKRSAGILHVGEANAFRGGLAFYTNNAADLTTDWSERMRIDMAGKVGIGTGGPGSYRLHVSSGAGESGTVMAVSTGSTNLFWVAGDGAHAVKFFGDGSGLTGVPGDNLGNHTATQALDLAGFTATNVSTITMQNGSIAIVQPGGTGSNTLYGISIGYGAANNYGNGIGIGRDATNNYSTGVGVGYGAHDNHDYGIGIGYLAYNNYSDGIGIGRQSLGNYNYGVGVGWAAGQNRDYGVGIGYGASGNNSSGIGIGNYAFSNNNSGVGVGSNANNNLDSGVGVGPNANQNYSSGVGVGSGARTNYTGGVGVGNDANQNSIYGVGIGASALSNSNRGVGIGAYAQGNSSYGVGIGAYSQNNGSYGTGVGAYTSSKSSAVALGYYARANSVDSVALGAGATTNAVRSVCIGAYCVNNAVDTAKIREGYTLRVDSISISAALAQLTVSTNVYIVGYSSAAKYYGDGSGLTGISGGSAGPSIDVSTINAAATTPYGGVSITTNVFVTGGARLAKAVVQAADSGLTLTADDFGKTITVNSASAQTVYLPSISAADIGATVRIIKLGAGTVTIDAADSDTIADSGAGDTIYNNSATPPYASLELLLATDTKWAVVAGDGAWITTD